jgi:hypothetical protein
MSRGRKILSVAAFALAMLAIAVLVLYSQKPKDTQDLPADDGRLLFDRKLFDDFKLTLGTVTVTHATATQMASEGDVHWWLAAQFSPQAFKDFKSALAQAATPENWKVDDAEQPFDEKQQMPAWVNRLPAKPYDSLRLTARKSDAAAGAYQFVFVPGDGILYIHAMPMP